MFVVMYLWILYCTSTITGQGTYQGKIRKRSLSYTCTQSNKKKTFKRKRRRLPFRLDQQVTPQTPNLPSSYPSSVHIFKPPP